MWRFGLLVLVISGIGRAQDARLSQIKAILEPMREHPLDHLETRGATPEFTTVKHLLRDWIESRLSELKQEDDPTALAGPLNDELRKAGLILRESMDTDVGEMFLGFLGEVRIERPGLLTIITGVGVQVCGFDESAYVYDFPADHWHRMFESEQNDYTKEKYLPQDIRYVHVSGPDYSDGADRTALLVMTLGWHRWCTSNWQDVYYRAWRIKSTYPAPKLLIDGSEWAFRAHEPEIKGSVGFNDVLIEYTIAGSGHSREEVRHYRISPDDKVTRIDPLALGPFDFLEEWRLRSWETSAMWTEPSSRQKLEPLHQRLQPEVGLEPYMPTTHCSDRPDLWQVVIDLGDRSRVGEPLPAFFLVRWKPPFRFTMVDASDHRWPACDELDPQADEPRTLFPSQDWR